jgi:hypothetical protein
MTIRDIENSIDHAKAVILANLVEEGLLSREDADKWSLFHHVLIRKKTIFKSLLSTVWKDAKESDDSEYYVVVKLSPIATLEVPAPEPETPEDVPTPEETDENPEKSEG